MRGTPCCTSSGCAIDIGLEIEGPPSKQLVNHQILASDELEGLIDTIDRERVIVLEAVTADGSPLSKPSHHSCKTRYDHAVWRAAQLLAAVGFFAVLLAGVVVFGFRRGSRSTGS